VAKLPYEKRTRVYWCTSISNINAPTAAEITAGVYLSPFTKKDGVQTPNNQNFIDSGDITTDFDSQEPGSWGGAPVNLTLFRDDTADTAWNLMVKGTRGFLVIARTKTVAPTAGDKVEVWPAAMHHPVMANSAPNENQTFTGAFAITAEPALKATVA
jgi:hypothetical protein